ncbi:hypothetical protein Stm18_016 [Stenotrophomonas phage Stm18]
MFGIMKYIAEAIVEAQVKEAKLRKDMQDQIECLRGKVQSLNMRNDNQAVLIGKLSGQLEENRRDYCTAYGSGRAVCSNKRGHNDMCSSCLMAELGRIGSPRSPLKKRYVVCTNSTTHTNVFRTGERGQFVGSAVAQFAYGAAGFALACQYVDFLNSLEG